MKAQRSLLMHFLPQFFVGLVVAIAMTSCSAQERGGLEAERISPSPDATPANVRKDLPQPKDENGTRDVFLYLDGHTQGRVAHLRIPSEYVSLTGRPVDRHATSMSISVFWPDLVSTNSPQWKAAFKQNGGRVPDAQINVGIRPNNITNLLYGTSRILGEMHKARVQATWITYEDIPPLPGFNQGIRKRNSANVKIVGEGNAVTDYYIDWLLYEQPQKFMSCRPYDPRPTCMLEIYINDGKTPINISLHFFSVQLPQLPQMTERIQKLVDSFVIHIYPANSQ